MFGASKSALWKYRLRVRRERIVVVVVVATSGAFICNRHVATVSTARWSREYDPTSAMWSRGQSAGGLVARARVCRLETAARALIPAHGAHPSSVGAGCGHERANSDDFILSLHCIALRM